MAQTIEHQRTHVDGVAVDLEVEAGRTLYLVVECPVCERQNRLRAGGIRVDEGVQCSCGNRLLRLRGRTVIQLERALEEMLIQLKPRRLSRPGALS